MVCELQTFWGLLVLSRFRFGRWLWTQAGNARREE
jgi:hypothetical protein